MGTPGRRKALKALARARRANLRRVAKGEKPVIDGKRVSKSTYAKHGGTTSAKEAKRRLKRR